MCAYVTQSMSVFLEVPVDTYNFSCYWYACYWKCAFTTAYWALHMLMEICTYYWMYVHVSGSSGGSVE